MDAIFPVSDEEIAARAGKCCGGRRAVSAIPILQSGGYTPARRLIVGFADGSSVFVKAATNENTAKWLRDEERVYGFLSGADFAPRRLGFDAGVPGQSLPLLVLEDLSDAHWPRLWRDGDVERVLAALARVHAWAPIPEDLPRLTQERDSLSSWRIVANDPAPFLSLGLCGRPWLDQALPTLLAADATAELDGPNLLHLDIRSDNICFPADGRGAIFVDWNWAMRGNRSIDIAGWLPSLHAEGGPRPDDILPDEPALAAVLAGFWCARAGLPPIPEAPRVRLIQRIQVGVALPWAARALGLSPPE